MAKITHREILRLDRILIELHSRNGLLELIELHTASLCSEYCEGQYVV